jgi:mono/diheme cytochrome c family protein
MIRWLLALAATGCIDAIAPDVGPIQSGGEQTCNTDADPATAVPYADVQQLFDDHCTRCHRPDGEGVQESGLDLTSYGALLEGGTRSVDTIVIAGEPCASVIFQKITDAPPFGSRMPRGDRALSAAEQQLLHDWISEGAVAP